ncbi:MAG: GNAT family N-acetyltransferase [Rhodospirillales bacterium]|nr:GNAT family N-acetyltransferase [Rhodospirillales bacterium]
MTITVEERHTDKAALADMVLRALSDWFGIEEATQDDIDAADRLPMLAARRDDKSIGFTSLEIVTPGTINIHAIGVLPDHHGSGAGRALIAATIDRCRQQNVRLLTVKTLSDASDDPFHAGTRQFYTAMGFAPAAEIPDLYDPRNPCLVMARMVDRI